MKTLLFTLLCLLSLSAMGQDVSGDLQSGQLKLDSTNRALLRQIDAMTVKMKAVEAMARAVNTADSLLGIKVNKMTATSRSGIATVTVAAGATKVYIPHGLGYKPTAFFAHVLKPGGTGNPEVDADAINIIVSLPTAPLLPTAYQVYWTFSNTP